ncbi:hypothetical protein B9Z51_13455 [Limnohabitans sp. T6-5]|uniref:DGQHR domain-containing protein n=1 Tax=Limnohabitans sp. T6-5 TaxID=1100724 RepID=UPI000D3A688A|nr:DGQHR domain-containing protein [Limnohabitans sp. T6-5]PUE06921.1 hypothetical protein B9Z51_13455 [Limnohabitans sp. T6-5]
MEKQKIAAIECRQWLADWDNYQYSGENSRAHPPKEMMLFSMSARLLKKLSGVYERKREGNVATGIQRAHVKDRSLEIVEYVKSGYPYGNLSAKQKSDIENDPLKKPGWLPTAIVVNLLKPNEPRRGKTVSNQDLISVSKRSNSNSVELELPLGIDCTDWLPTGVPPIEIIDGQHRLFAFDEKSGLPEDFELPVVAFHGLDIGWQAYLFWSINVSPKRINPSHAYDLFPLLRTQDWLEATPSTHVYREARAQELTDLLYRHEQSPWHQRINMLGERKSGWISQASWVQAIFNSFLSPGLSARSRKGLFAANLSQTKGPLEWSRPQQAAFLIFLWSELANGVRKKQDGWAEQIRKVDGDQIDFSDGHDIAFSGSKSLLNHDQGVRGFSLAINDILFAMSEELHLPEWKYDDINAGETRDSDIDKCLEDINKQSFYQPLLKAMHILANFDWRSFDAPGLNTTESLMKASFRGTGGYSRLRRELLNVLASGNTALSATAKNISATEIQG